MTLGKLVRQILRHVPELMRLRLSSIDQVEADAELIAAIAEEPRLMPHFHLSLQSGDDMILKRMKRRHLRAGAIALLRTRTRAAAGRRLRRRLDCGIPDRNRGNVCQYIESRRRLQIDASPRLSVLAAPGDAGGEDAAGRSRHR